ncbi:MAG: ATP-binding cassette domain-containing protein [Rhodothermales bacterium]|nr:ATP-binding cassette domain-containing protein [Rhodothermales bacterium]
MIQLYNISKSYDGHTALADVSLDFLEHRTTAVIGPSGCGKSTLLRVIIGLVTPDTGKVNVFDRNLSTDTLIDTRRRIGYVIQDGGLFPHLTARENVEMMARHLQWSDADIGDRIHSLALLVRLPEDRLDLFPVELSGGQRQRVGLMRSLMLDPSLLLLDEPLGALDPMIRAELQTELRDIFGSLKKTVVLVTHDLSEAAFLADRIVLMRNGQVVQSGQIEDLLERPAVSFVSDFVNAQRRHIGEAGAGAP